MGDKNGKQDKNDKAKTKKSTAFDIDNPSPAARHRRQGARRRAATRTTRS